MVSVLIFSGVYRWWRPQLVREKKLGKFRSFVLNLSVLCHPSKKIINNQESSSSRVKEPTKSSKIFETTICGGKSMKSCDEISAKKWQKSLDFGPVTVSRETPATNMFSLSEIWGRWKYMQSLNIAYPMHMLNTYLPSINIFQRIRSSDKWFYGKTGLQKPLDPRHLREIDGMNRFEWIHIVTTIVFVNGMMQGFCPWKKNLHVPLTCCYQITSSPMKQLKEGKPQQLCHV